MNVAMIGIFCFIIKDFSTVLTNICHNLDNKVIKHNLLYNK